MQTYLNLELPEGTPTNAPRFEYQADTMQVPWGEHSILWALEAGEVTAVEATFYLALNHGSSWQSGQTWIFSQGPTAEKLGISKSYAKKIIDSMTHRWISPIKTPRGNRYQLVHHLCDDEDVPVDRDGKPLKFAVPRGDGGPFEQLYAGDISWKACLAWIVHKLYSDWETGETYKCTTGGFATRCRLGQDTVREARRELIDADMLYRLSKPHEKSVFQLFPKPHPQPEKREKHEKQPAVRKEYSVMTDVTHWISNNWQYRQHRATGITERRRGEGKWTEVTDQERSLMPKAIKEDFDKATYADALKLRRMEKHAERSLHFP